MLECEREISRPKPRDRLTSDDNRPCRRTLYSDRWRPPLDVAAMRDAAQVLTGEHDFTTFRGAGSEAHTSVRTITRIAWSGTGGPADPLRSASKETASCATWFAASRARSSRSASGAGRRVR